jgi:hypothetical protein
LVLEWRREKGREKQREPESYIGFAEPRLV